MLDILEIIGLSEISSHLSVKLRISLELIFVCAVKTPLSSIVIVVPSILTCPNSSLDAIVLQ
jgi:hypothetical protein